MKFGQTFAGYLHGEQAAFLNKCSHLEYKRLKKVLKTCRLCRAANDESRVCDNEKRADDQELPELCQCDPCAVCDKTFFTELTKEVSEIAGCFSYRVRRLLDLHFSSGIFRYMWSLRHCFTDDQQVMAQQGRMLLDYVTMNAIAINKILKKYDKIHGSTDGRKFKNKMRTKHVELLHSPWVIELGAFYLNCSGADFGEPGEFFNKFSCNLSDTEPTEPVITMTLLGSVTYEYSLLCAICLEMVFNPYALACGHLFCKGCACSAASVLLFQGLKEAPRGAKCPVCREVGVYKDTVHMTELDLLLRNRCKKYWKERLQNERAEMVKQAKEYWESQAFAAMAL